LTFEQVRRTMLLRSIYVLVAPIFMVFAALACAGTPLADAPVYTCPTAVPQPTATTLAGTPSPTLPPPPTPYVITPPQPFYVGDAVFVGGATSPVRVRFRLQNVQSYAAPPGSDGAPRRVYAWQLEVRNAGTGDYQVFPAVQMVLSEVTTASGNIVGTWGSSQAAADAAALTIDNNVYTLARGQTRTFRFAAFAPAGTARRFTFTLDPTVTEGSSVITWTNQTNPYCSGDVAP
ncbi:MAG: hypothetical protein L0Y32_06195, partial [Nevskiales bacterium]|nr:hypothetical protein [Nevskiales bacterium]